MSGLIAPGGGGAVELIGKVSASAVAAVDFAWPGLVYNKVQLIIHAAAPAVDDVEAWLRFSNDGGGTFETANYKWAYESLDWGTDAQLYDSDALGESAINMASSVSTFAVGNAANEDFSAVVDIIRPSLAEVTHGFFVAHYEDGTGSQVTHSGDGRLSADVIDGVRFLFESGDIATGEFVCYGWK